MVAGRHTCSYFIISVVTCQQLTTSDMLAIDPSDAETCEMRSLLVAIRELEKPSQSVSETRQGRIRLPAPTTVQECAAAGQHSTG